MIPCLRGGSVVESGISRLESASHFGGSPLANETPLRGVERYRVLSRFGIPLIRYLLRMPTNLDKALPELLGHLELENSGEDRYRGTSPPTSNGRIYGGLVFSQAMQAGLASVDPDRPPHSAHAYFLRPGDPTLPIEFEVDRIRDGRSFTTRRVVARQGETAILNLALSCHVDEGGAAHQVDVEMPAEPSGESHESGIRRGLEGLGIKTSQEDFGFGAFEVLAEGGLDMSSAPPRPPHLTCWLRARGSVPEAHGLHESLLAYVSDLTIAIPAFHPHEFGAMTPGLMSASLDHAMWFHAPFRVDEWIYAVQDSPVSGASRGLGRILFYSQDGRLVASGVQEALMRYRPAEA